MQEWLKSVHVPIGPHQCPSVVTWIMAYMSDSPNGLRRSVPNRHKRFVKRMEMLRDLVRKSKDELSKRAVLEYSFDIERWDEACGLRSSRR